MVDFPTGRMKSREGTVVDADEFLNEMISTAKSISKELGKLEDMKAEKADELYSTIGLGAFKIFMLKVDQKNVCYLTRKNLLILMVILVLLFSILLQEYNL